MNRKHRPQVAVSSHQRAIRVPRKRIVELVELIDSAESELSLVDIAFLDEEEIARCNREYLSHQGPTDVISFDLSEPDDERLSVQLLICGPVAKAQAKQHGQPITREVLRYVAHGLLHQMGYDDQDAHSAARMHAREDELLEKLETSRRKRR
jgi:probable rRNA maturation factor